MFVTKQKLYTDLLTIVYLSYISAAIGDFVQDSKVAPGILVTGIQTFAVCTFNLGGTLAITETGNNIHQKNFFLIDSLKVYY